MEILVWACAGLSVLCGAGAALCQNLGRWLEKFICKTSASVLFCMTAVLALGQSGDWRTACPIFAALVLGLVGDICLACPRLMGRGGAPQQIWLAFGLVCFGLGHLVYTGMFLARADWALWPLLAAPVLPVVLWLLIRLGFCRPEPAAIAVGTYLYAAVVGVMAGGAALCVLCGEGPDLWLAAALLFVVSDSTLTRDTFPVGALEGRPLPSLYRTGVLFPGAESVCPVYSGVTWSCRPDAGAPLRGSAFFARRKL